MQDSLPAGWLAFAGRELNPLDRYERFPSCYISSPFPEFILTLDSFEHGGRLERFGAGGCRNLTQHAHFNFPPLHAANPAAAHKHQECRQCARKIIEKFNPLILGEVHTAGNTPPKRSTPEVGNVMPER